MSMMKLSFVRGLQSALVSSGAIPPYRTQFHADLAVKVAALRLPTMWKMATEEQVADAMSSMASGQETSLSPEQQQAVVQAPQSPVEASQEQADLEEAVQALEEQAAMANAFADSTNDAADKLEELSDAQAAKEVVAMLKAAGYYKRSNDIFGGGVANQAPALLDDYESEAGARAAAGYAHLNGAQGLADPSANASPFTGSMKDLHEGVSLDSKTASFILRKLAEDAAYNVGPEVADPDNIEEDPRGDSYANFSQGDGAFEDTAPFTGDMQKASAYNYLLQKTAQEVGRYLPKGLSSRDKLAAVRAMIGMSNPERANYIKRIKWAMEEESDDSSSENDMPEQLREYAEKQVEKEEEDESKSEEKEEKSAAYILRQLGLGSKNRRSRR
jgi:hypothetical protein